MTGSRKEVKKGERFLTMILKVGLEPRLEAGPIVSIDQLKREERPAGYQVMTDLAEQLWQSRGALLESAAAVVTVTVIEGQKPVSGTGFYIARDLIVSAAHLLKDPGRREHRGGGGSAIVSIETQDGRTAAAHPEIWEYRSWGRAGYPQLDFMFLRTDLLSANFLRPDFGPPAQSGRPAVAVLGWLRPLECLWLHQYNLSGSRPPRLTALAAFHRALFPPGARGVFFSAGLLSPHSRSAQENIPPAIFEYNASTVSGCSGAPVLSLKGDQRTVRFIHLGANPSRGTNYMMSVCQPAFQRSYQQLLASQGES